MNVQGRNLTPGLTGADVAELHEELAQLGYPVPAEEQAGKSFGQGTHDAVVQFQTDQKLQATGIVDAAVAAVLGQAVLDNTYNVTGTVTSPVRAGVGGLTVQPTPESTSMTIISRTFLVAPLANALPVLKKLRSRLAS